MLGDGSLCAWRCCFLWTMTGIKQLSFSITITSSGVQYCNVSYSLTYAIVNPPFYWDLFIGLYWFWVFAIHKYLFEVK